MKTWNHPGGNLIELGPSALTDEELLAILIGSGYKGRPAQDKRDKEGAGKIILKLRSLTFRM